MGAWPHHVLLHIYYESPVFGVTLVVGGGGLIAVGFDSYIIWYQGRWKGGGARSPFLKGANVAF